MSSEEGEDQQVAGSSQTKHKYNGDINKDSSQDEQATLEQTEVKNAKYSTAVKRKDSKSKLHTDKFREDWVEVIRQSLETDFILSILPSHRCEFQAF